MITTTDGGSAWFEEPRRDLAYLVGDGTRARSPPTSGVGGRFEVERARRAAGATAPGAAHAAFDRFRERRRDVVAVRGRRLAEHVVEQPPERRVRARRLVRVARDREAGADPRRGSGSPREAGLADAGVADDLDRTAGPGAHVRERIAEQARTRRSRPTSGSAMAVRVSRRCAAPSVDASTGRRLPFTMNGSSGVVSNTRPRRLEDLADWRRSRPARPWPSAGPRGSPCRP